VVVLKVNPVELDLHVAREVVARVLGVRRHHDRLLGVAWPRASLPLSANTHLHALSNSCDRMCL
jgi:hypothetical protein